jgi:O-antigen/teichoic acid export membrane protein
MSAIRNISFFLAATLIARAMGILQSFAVAKFLGPASFGVWVMLLLLVAYAPILCLGTVETLLKQVPYFLGRNEPARVREVESSVLGSIVLAAGAILILAAATPLVLPLTGWRVSSSLVVMVMVTVAINDFTSFFYHRFSAHENFRMTGSMDAARAVFALVFVAGMGWFWGLRGVVIGYLCHEICMFLITAGCNIRAHGAPGLSFHGKSIFYAVRIGLPISLLWWVLTLTASVDRLVLGSLSDDLAIGHYGLGVQLSGILFLVPTVVGRVLYPKVNKHFGQNADARAMRRVILAPTMALGTLLANLQIALLVGTPLLYNTILPKYRPGLLAGQILILGCYFYCLFRNGANYLIAANLERLFLKYIVCALVFNGLTDVALVKAGFGIVGVAYGTSLAGLFLTTLVWRRVLYGLGFDRRQQWIHLFELYLPFTALAVAFAFICLVYPASFRVFSVFSVLFGILLLAAVNGLLYCFPKYRAEMQSWNQRFLRRNRTPVVAPAQPRPGVAGPLC